MKLLSLNVCAVSAAHKLASLDLLIRRTHSPDVVFFQEVACPSFSFFGYTEAVNVGAAGRGTAILWRKDIELTDIMKLPSGRAVSARLGDVTLINVYAPAGTQGRRERPRFLTEELPMVMTGADEKLILGGDWNAVLDKQGTTGVATPCPVLRNLVTSLQLTDAWKALRPREVGFTFHSAVCSSRLDRWYVSSAVDWPLHAVHLHAAPVSDHTAVLLELGGELGNPTRGAAGLAADSAGHRTLWKLDPALLRYPAFLPRFKAFWEHWRGRAKDFKDIVEWWEQGKAQSRSLCAALTREYRAADNSLLAFYSGCLDELAMQRTANPAVEPRIKDIKARILELLASRLPGLSARAKTTEVVGEMPGVHHVAAAIRRKTATRIASLQDDDGQVLHSQDDLQRLAHRHFSAVLGAPQGTPPPPPRLLEEVTEKVVSEEDNEALLCTITSEELLRSLKMSPRGRSPGDDGLTAEFYLAVWEIIETDFLEVANVMLQRRRVAPSHTRGVMTLIPKSGTVTKIGDLRPITLLNVDGKVLSRVLARRLDSIQNKMLDGMQVRGGSSRNMHGALLDLRDAVNVVNLTNKQRGSSVAACMVSVDFAGAFNNVLHSYLWDVLRRYGVAEDFTKLLQSLYAGASTRVRLNGLLGAVIMLGRGVRQGCPLSMALFNIAISPLLRALSRRLAGVSVPDVTGSGAVLRLAATSYVDDATVLLTHPDEALVLANTLEAYGVESGLRTNPTKTKALPLGSWKASTPMPFPYVEEVKVLGIVFTRTTAGMPAANWPARLQALRGALVDARLRSLNLLQRVLYANCYALTVLWHCAQVLPIPAGVAKDARKALSKFLWAGEPLRVPLDVLVLPPGRGGLGLHDPTTKSKAMFAARWLTASRAAEPTLSGGWLAVLQQLYEDTTNVPAAASFYRAFRTTCGMVDVPDNVQGQALNRALFQDMVLKSTIVPRVQRRSPTADWSSVWARVGSRTLPLRARSAWFRAVHDVLPTNARLKATHQADDAACRTCGAEDSVLHRLLSCQPASRAIWAWTAAELAEVTDVVASSIGPETLIVPDIAAPPGAATRAVILLLGTVAEYVVEHRVHDLQQLLALVRERRRTASHDDTGTPRQPQPQLN